MNWLSSIDRLLEGRPLVDEDDDTDYSGSSGLDDELEDEGSSFSEEDSSHHVQLSFGQSKSSTIDDEEEAEFAGDDAEESNVPLSSPAPQPLQRTMLQQQVKPGLGAAQPVRPGNIRLRLKRSVSSSSEEDEDDEEEKSQATTSASPRQSSSPREARSTPQAKNLKPEPIPISEHDSLLPSLNVSKSSYSMEGTISSGDMPLSIQDSDTSSSNFSPQSQRDTDCTSPKQRQGSIVSVVSTPPQLSYVSKIRSAISSSSPALQQQASLAQANSSPLTSNSTPSKSAEQIHSPLHPESPPKDEASDLVDRRENKMVEETPLPIALATEQPQQEESNSIDHCERDQQHTIPLQQPPVSHPLSPPTRQVQSVEHGFTGHSSLVPTVMGTLSCHQTENMGSTRKQEHLPTTPQLTSSPSEIHQNKANCSETTKEELQLAIPTDYSGEKDSTPIQSNKQTSDDGATDLAAPQQHRQDHFMTPESPPIQHPNVGLAQTATMQATQTYMTPESASMGQNPGENDFPSDPASVSSGWSWPDSKREGNRADDDDDGSAMTDDVIDEQESFQQQQTVIEAGFLKGEQEKETPQRDLDNVARPTCNGSNASKNKASESEGLGTASADWNAKENDQGDDVSPPFQDAEPKHCSTAHRLLGNAGQLIPQSPTRTADEDSEFQSVDSLSEDNNQSPAIPKLVPQSERTLVASNLEPQTESCNRDPSEVSEPSCTVPEVDGVDGVDDSTEDESPKDEPNNDKHNDAENKSETKHDPKLFEVEEETSAWREDPATLPLEPLNCYGAFHIRLLRAQRLPCPGGSTVRANVSLLPWKGKARTNGITTFLLDHEHALDDHGVCAQWEDSHTVSLVHAYASEATPLPTLKMELTCPMALLEFSICSLSLPCDILMKRPGSWTRQWFVTSVPDVKNNQMFEGQIPMLEIEAVFMPEDKSLGVSFVALDKSNKLASSDELDIDLVPSRDRADTLESSVHSLTAKHYEADKDGEVELAPSGMPHLLRYKKFWKPATCGQCSTSLLGWKTKSFRCEACGIDCCEDCRVHLDVQIPCGSSQCIQIVSTAIQNKLTLTSFMDAMAPIDKEYAKKRELLNPSTDAELSLTDTRTEGGTISRAGEKGRIGVLKLNIAKACVFSSPLPAASEPEEVIGHDTELRSGDYYVRVCRSGSVSSARTRTIPSGGKLKFEEASEMRLDVSHYQQDFYIEVVDAITDKPVGTSVLTTQGVLQQQRDLMIEEGKLSILTFGSKPPAFKGKRRMTLELRAGVKSGIRGDFFVPADASEEKGKISGWVELSVGLEEDSRRLYGPTPYECPAPPPDPFNLSTMELHISRLSDFVEDILSLFAKYQYAVSWKSPLLTGFFFALFLAFTIKFDSEYVGCLPFLFIMVCMLASAFSRRNAKNRFVQEEADEWKKAEKDIDVNYTLHRPIGRVSISVTKGQHIRSRELGLAGNVGCRVYLDPVRFANEKQKEKLINIDKSAKTIHEIGSTEYKFKTNPLWESIHASEECRRLKQVLPHHGYFFETEEELSKESGCDFPVLQPFRRVDDEDGDNPRFINAALDPWRTSTAGVVFQVRFKDILNMLPGSDHIFGEIALPLATVVEQKEISGWFQVLEVGTKDYVKVDERPMMGQVEDTPIVGEPIDQQVVAHDVAKIFLTLKWNPPEDNLDSIEARETDREASIVIQEELLRWESTNRDKDKLKQLVVGSSIGAFKTVSGFAGTLQVIQNFLGKLANTLEAVRNLLNFTDPYKSSLVLAVVTILWLVLSLLPTRLIIFVAGLAQFGITAKTRIEKIMRDSSGAEAESESDDISVASDLDEDEEGADAPIIWLKNAFSSLPTDEDLRKAYFWEGRRIGVKTKESYESGKRMARLKGLWRAHWHAMIKLRSNVTSKNNSKERSCVWESIFAVVQGRRFLWWQTVSDFDSGKPPQGRIFLAGHAGLSGLSPLEMREIDPKDVALVVGIFGKGLQREQQKVTLLLPNEELKDSLENAVICASLKKD